MLAVHGHFYQPERRDPFSGEIAPQPGAAPYRDWNTRIDAECYKPNAERGNLGRISFDLGPTLAGWLAEHDPATHRGFVAADTAAAPAGSAAAPGADPDPACGNAVAQAYNHAILPLASMADRRTEIRWGLRDFELRFGRRATGLWLPETAVDLPTLRILADEGIRYTILAPWQAADARLDTRRPYRVDLGSGRSLAVVFYDSTLSSAASFDGAATTDADAFARDLVAPRLAGPGFADGMPYLAVMATDGELYGHHQKFRDLFLARLVNPGPEVPARAFDVTTVGRVICAAPAPTLPPAQIVERTSWSCHHGVLRWSAECPDAADGRWKGPLRAALDRLAAGIDILAEDQVRRFMKPAALWQARDEYVDVVFGAETAGVFRDAATPQSHPRGARRSAHAHGSSALAAGDVRQRRLVLGRSRPAGDQAAAAVRREGCSHDGRGRPDGPGAAAGRRPFDPGLTVPGRGRGRNLCRGPGGGGTAGTSLSAAGMPAGGRSRVAHNNDAGKRGFIISGEADSPFLRARCAASGLRFVTVNHQRGQSWNQLSRSRA